MVLNPKYERLRSWIEGLPAMFEREGEVIYDARNQIRRYEVDGLTLCVKRFHRPMLLNRIIYTFFRPSKAKRSYLNGLYLIEHQIGTPEPIAYIEEHSCGLIGFSYLVTLQSSLTRLNREWTLNYSPELEDTIRPLARFTAQMHESQALHYDFSPGNILWDKVDGEYRFEVIDINRMRIGQKVTLRDGARSLRRLCAKTSFFLTFADEYAQQRGFDKEECTRWILYYRDQFWQHGRKANYDYV